jgi:NADH:ubiquinone oxidoreductase subunit H
VLFFGGWHAPIDVGGLLANLGVTINPALDLGQLGIWLLILVMTGPVLATLLLAIPIWMLRSEMPFWKALVIGFLLFNLFAMVGVLVWLALSFEAVIGLIWFLVKTYAFVFTFVWMRGVLPRARVDQLMGFAWKWLLPASLLNLFVTAAAILITPGAPR